MLALTGVAIGIAVALAVIGCWRGCFSEWSRAIRYAAGVSLLHFFVALLLAGCRRTEPRESRLRWPYAGVEAPLIE